MLRVRFAPSPTGELHVGGARTALFNWLFARNKRGKFILRIEDTDIERSSDEVVNRIFEALRWLGLIWDEGPFYQSHRLSVYRDYAERLVKMGCAYYCYCTSERIRKEKERAIAEGKTWRYDRHCLNLSPEEIKRNEEKGLPRAIRFKVPEGETRFTDLVHGEVSFSHDNIEDFVLLRSDSHPTYHLSVVVDDIDMKITHVIRGDDHLSNTPKQIMIYKALGVEPPHFAHLPLILGPDKRRLSKRHGATSVLAYRLQGFLPGAMVNFLALLGWSPGDDRTIIPREELIELFSLSGVSKSNAVFDITKLEWLNGQYISMEPAEELAPLVAGLLTKAGLWNDAFLGEKKDWFLRLIDLLKPRVRLLPDFVRDATPFLKYDFKYDEEAVAEHFADPELPRYFEELKDDFTQLPRFTTLDAERALRLTADRLGIKAAAIIHPLRVALSGKKVGPGIFELLEVMGKDRTLHLINRAIELLRKGGISSKE
jgi:nondiscriminating glutamyl-tRNA synthetase